jgi:hypothetical protein
MEHAAEAQRGQAVGCSSCGSQLGPGRGSAEMISDGCTDANREVLVKGVGENLLPPDPNVGTLGAGLSGSGSKHRKPSFRPALLSPARSGLGREAQGSAALKQDERTHRPHAW